MRKSIVCAVAFVALSFLIAAPAPASAQEYVLEMGTVVPAGSPWALQLKRLKKYVEEETGGRVKVKLRLGGSNERSLARRTQMGSKQGFAGSVGGLSSIVREVNVLEAPYVFDTVEQADKALDDPEVLKQVRAILGEAEARLRALGGERLSLVLQPPAHPDARRHEGHSLPLTGGGRPRRGVQGHWREPGHHRRRQHDDQPPDGRRRRLRQHPALRDGDDLVSGPRRR